MTGSSIDSIIELHEFIRRTFFRISASDQNPLCELSSQLEQTQELEKDKKLTAASVEFKKLIIGIKKTLKRIKLNAKVSDQVVID